MARIGRSWSLRRRILVASAIGLLLLSAAGVAGFAWALDSILTSAATQAAKVQAGQLSALIKAGKYSPVDAITNLPPEGAILQVIEPGGRILASTNESLKSSPLTDATPAPGKVIVTQIDHLADLNEPYAIAAEGVKSPKGERYIVAVAAPLTTEARTVRVSTELLAGGALLFGTVLLLAVGRIVRGSLAPVRQIEQEVSRISRAGSDERVTVPPTRDEIAALATTMNSMLDRMARADAATKRFVSDASHELRSPLATLRTQVETAKPATADSIADIELMEAEVLRMQHLVTDLLTLARADDAGLHLKSDEVDLDDVVEQEVKHLKAITHQPVSVHLEPVSVTGDEARLAQVLRNLTDNGLRHSTGGLGVTMDTSEPGWVSVHVDNAGDPIPVASREAVFDRFTRLDDARARNAGGSGLGLAIARTIVQAHGGTVTTSESPAGGCRFTVTLPIRPDEEPGASVPVDA